MLSFFVIDNAQQFINEQVFSFKHGKKSGSIKNTQDLNLTLHNTGWLEKIWDYSQL